MMTVREINFITKALLSNSFSFPRLVLQSSRFYLSNDLALNFTLSYTLLCLQGHNPDLSCHM